MPDPPTIHFESLSLNGGQPSEPERLSSEVTDFSFRSPSSGSGALTGGVFVFGQHHAKFTFPASPPANQGNSRPGPSFLFEGAGAEQPFTFRSLHNVTPLPSRSASREPSPQLPAGPALRMSSPQIEAPSTPTPVGRQRSLSVMSSSPINPGQADAAVRPSTPVITPYDARDEPAPPHTLFTPALQEALKDGCDIAKKAATAIEEMKAIHPSTTDNDLDDLLANANSLRSFHGSDTRTIAVLGDSGEGKSSLINSLLHFPGIALTGDIGSACTSIVTEYRQKKPGHVAPITVEVQYLSTSEIAEQIRELLWSYRQLFLPGVESKDTPEQDYARYMRESEHAWSALQAAFKHKREFTQSFAQDMSEGALERITDQLCHWAQEIQWPNTGADGFWTSTAQTAEECVEHTKIFMQDRYWPFTKIIRVYLSSQVLKTGVVLADLPGLQDTNLARVRATQDYLIKCDNIIIVAKISRAITDQSLKSSLFFVLSRHLPTEWNESGAQKLNVAVVCTRSEEINARTARSEFCGPNNRISTEVMSQLDEEIDAAKAREDRVAKKAAKRKQEILLVQARNDHVKESLQNVYSAEMDGRKTLNVFCISNKWYEKYCRKGNTELVQASGIPELRRFCHTLTADAQLNEVGHFLKSKLPTLLNSVDLWASSSLSRRGELIALDDSMYNELGNATIKILEIVGKFRREFIGCFNEQVMDYFVRRGEKWEQAATIEGEKWKIWHWTQYNAWCRNNGDHQTLKRGHENWNAKIIWKMRMELENQWDLIEEEISEYFSTLLGDARDIFVWLNARIREIAPSEWLDFLLETISWQIQSLEYTLNKEEERFFAEVRTIRRYTSEANYNSYVLRDMIPVYRSATSKRGTGQYLHQKSIVQGHIENGMVFSRLSITLSTSMNELVASTEGRLVEVLKNAMRSVERDADLIFRSQLVVERRKLDDQDWKRHVEEFAGGVKILKQRHQRLLRSIESV